MELEISFLKTSIPYGSIIFDGQEFGRIDEISKLSIKSNCDFTFSIDTRTTLKNQIFLAIPGENVDGHDFLQEALTSGAAALIIEESKKKLLKKIDNKFLKNILIIIVPDTLKALIDLAKNWRKKFNYPVIGVTGSVGKTTTKEMLKSIFDSAGINSCVSLKNQNTLIGLCLNILRMKKTDQVAAFELGISEKGEMEKKVEILCPTIGVITTVAHSHMATLGQLPEIAKEKKNIFKFFKQDYVGIVFGDSPLLGDSYYSHPVIRFGFKTKNHIQARRIKICKDENGNLVANFLLKIYKEKVKIRLKTHHRGNVQNSLAAAAVCNLIGVPVPEIVKGLNSFEGFEGRFEKRILKKDLGLLISDCYNASPESMRNALLAVDEIGVDGLKIAVLGDMLELGEKEDFWHRQVGRILCKALSIKEVILVGGLAKKIGETAPITAKIEYAKDWREALKKLDEKLDRVGSQNISDSLVLVKASNGMKLDNLVKGVSL